MYRCMYMSYCSLNVVMSSQNVFFILENNRSVLNYPFQPISSILVVIRITLWVWIICIKRFRSSEFITMKLNRWICTSSVLQSINCSSSSLSQEAPGSVVSVQVLVCFCSPPPHAFVHVPSFFHSVHEKQSVEHCNRNRIIQLYNCYR